jgi:hypothetical protein
VESYENQLTYLTGDLKGEAAMEPDATLPLLPLGACATRGILAVVLILILPPEIEMVVEFAGYPRWKFGVC